LLGFRLPPWRKARKRRLIETEKYFLFDVGIVRALSGMRLIQPGTEEHGRAFEHFLIQEIRAYLSYRERDLPLSYWRTSTGLEVDLIVGKLDLAIEIKASAKVGDGDARGLRALAEDQKVKRSMIVCLADQPRRLADGIEVWPWQLFCRRLWAGDWF
jgi:predicted AAA+ superfamily ATPase